MSGAELEVLGLSLRVALVGVGVALVPGIACAWVLARGRFGGRWALDALVHLPLVVPPVVVGYALLMTLGRGSVVGGFLYERMGIDVAFTWKAAAIASGVVGFPLLVRPIRLAMELVDREQEDSARALGASRWRVFMSITLPLSSRGVLAGLVMALARSMGEFGATIAFAGNIPGQSRTLPLAIYTLMQTPGGEGAVLRLVGLSIGVSVAALVGSEVLVRRAGWGRDRLWA